MRRPQSSLSGSRHSTITQERSSFRKESHMQPEAGYRVTVDDTAVSCTTPGGDMSTVTFAELESVIIRTTDEGPGVPDVFWVLTGAGQTCVVPQGATGEEALIDRLMTLPGFRFETMIAAMSCTENQEFDCWKG
ncbi:MAG: hypothetical protein HY326_06540 [Chloroflexi bacterium]|nr:hypothetical protein [Chloroflexota bacterium]